MERVNKRKEISDKLKQEGKSTFLDSPEDYQIRQRLRNQMEKVRRNYLKKSYNSEIKSNEMVYTA